MDEPFAHFRPGMTVRVLHPNVPTREVTIIAEPELQGGSWWIWGRQVVNGQMVGLPSVYLCARCTVEAV